ncbi:MAG: DUF115 domain-containing protein [Helicobacteraceae bacterium]|jgi:hypothetical protein|nr:DUF115 domain-containing protein [Helicobacteraceae bacterium]
MEKTYQGNLEALRGVNRELWRRLKECEGNERFEVFAGKDPLDVNLFDTVSQKALYGEPIGDTEQKLLLLAKKMRYPFLCFFGLGNGFLLKALLKNRAFAHLIVIEPYIEIFYIALHLNDFRRDIESGRLIAAHIDDFNADAAMRFFKLDKVTIYSKLYDLEITTPYYGGLSAAIEQTNTIMIEAILQSIQAYGNDLGDSLMGVENFLINRYEMIENIPFTDLIRQKNSDLAVLVATGPSLTKQLPLLKEIQEFVTIISVDASLPILERWGIIPDIVTSIERVEATSKFYESTSEEFQKKVGCFALSALCHKKTVSLVKGTKCLIMRPFGYMFAFDLKNFGYAGIGMSAANLSFEIAFMMGFKRAAFIGQDLAYGKDDLATHADDHIFGTKDPSAQQFVKDENMVRLPAWGGSGEVLSNKVWVLFRNFFIQNIADAKNAITVYNCTEGGCHIDGAEDRPFDEIVGMFVDKGRKKAPFSLRPEPRAIVDEYREKIKKTIASMIEMAQRTIDENGPLLSELNGIGAQLEGLTREEQLASVDFEKIDRINKRIEKFKKRLSDELFMKYFNEAIKALVINQEMDIAKIVVRIAENIDEKRAIELDFLCAHRFWLFTVLGAIEAQRGIMLKYAD